MGRGSAVEDSRSLEAVEGNPVGVLVLDGEGSEVHRSARVAGLLEGTALANPDRMRSRVAALAQRCQATGEMEVERFEPGTKAKTSVRLSAAALPGGGTVIMLEPVGASEFVDDRVRQFISQVTHDLRTPLTSVLGASDLLLSGRIGEPDERHKKLLRIVGEGTQKMAALLSDLAVRFLESEARR